MTDGPSAAMYDSQERRDADIAEDAGLPRQALVDAVRASHAALQVELERLPRDRYDVTVDRVPGSGGFTAGSFIWARERELEIHHADLGVPYSPADWPPEFATRLVGFLVEDRAEGPSAVLRATDVQPDGMVGGLWKIGPGPVRGHRHRRRPGMVAGRPRFRRRAGLVDRRDPHPRKMEMTMSYHGKVKPGGPADVRELADLIITKLAVDDEMANNAYLLRCRSTDDQLLIDAADDSAALLGLIGGDGLTSVATTHQHWDHHRALAAVVGATTALTVAGAEDADAITEQTGVAIDRRVGDGDQVRVGSCALEVIHLVGHTPGSIALLYDDPSGTPHLWTGDALFPGGPGRTSSPEDFDSLMRDLQAKVFDRLPDETWFYPGHGDDSTLGAERSHLSEWRERGW